MTYQEIKSFINTYIMQNGVNAITGSRLNTVLNALADYYGFDSVVVTTLPAGSEATVNVQGRTLELGIPKGADGADGRDGQDGQNAVSPFKGWFNAVVTGEAGSRVITSETQNLPANPVVGDYAYVKTWEITGIAPEQVETPIAKIYECATAGTWSDSGRTADTSNVQTFASGEEVNEVHIVNDFTTGGTEDVASAETVKKLNTDKLDKQKKNISYTYTSIDSVGDPYPKTGYLQANGTEGNLPDDYKFRIDKFPVTEGNSYYITGKEGTSTSNSLAGFYDLNGNLIAGSLIDSGVANAEASRRKVIAPSGAAYIKIMTNDYEGDFNAKCEARTEIVTILQDNQDVIDSVGDVADLETTEKSTVVGAINEVANNLGEIEEIHVSPNLFDKTQVPDDNKVVDTGGNLVNIPSWTFNKHTPLIPVEPNKYYRISGCNINVGINIVCFAADGTTKMKVLAPATGTEYTIYVMPNADGTSSSSSRMNTQFLTPPTAAYVQFNIATTSIDATDTTMIELVGDTYNPDFVPSEYEEYGSKRIIKESALPNINIEGIEEAIEKSDNAIGRKFKIKLLLVGSSHGMNTISQFPWIAYKSGIDIEVGNVYIGSFSLQRLVGMNERNEKCTLKYFKDGVWTSYANKSFAEVFGYTDWDFVSVQRSASDDQLWITTQNEADTIHNGMTNINYGTQLSAVYMSHNEALQYVLNLIRNNVTKQNCEVIFNTGFADPSEGLIPSQTSEIISTAKDMKEQFGIDYVPVAIAVRNARNTYLRHFGNWSASNANATNQLCYDSQHLDYGIGCYVPSMCLLEFVCRKVGWSTINLKGYGTQAEVGSFTSTALTDGNYTEPTDETMSVAKACAMCACNTPDTPSTKLSDRFKWKIDYSLSNGITASNSKGYCGNLDTYSTTLSGTISNVVITSKPWDRAQPSTTLVEGTDYTYDSSTGKVVIGSVQGDITITAS